MAGWSDNIEAVARALCAKQLARDEWSEQKLAFEVDMWWHLVAAEIEAGVVDEAGKFVGGEMGWKRKMDGYRDWMRRHPRAARSGTQRGTERRYPVNEVSPRRAPSWSRIQRTGEGRVTPYPG